MCGINLIIDKRKTIPASAIQGMTSATTHRGPDYTAYQVVDAGNSRIYLGHNRLKIIDVSDSANQPFYSADGRYILLYNGEIYNYQDLRKTLLQQGCIFRTDSDTEVILQLLIREGKKALAQLNGMFALAFYDTQQQQLWLARDRFGIKPLFYAETDECLIFSSEIKGIFSSGLIKKRLDSDQIYHYLHYKYAAKPKTFYQQVLELPEGTILSWEHGKNNVSSYLSDQLSQAEWTNPDKLLRNIDDLLTQSVLKHLVADVNVGLFLSGGIDSTLLLALLQRAGHQHFPAFTIAHAASTGSFGTEDTTFARLAAQQYEANHTLFEIDDSILEGTDAWVQHLNQPVADGAGLLTSYLAQKVKPYIKVALSGAGADELFAGYNRHWAFYQYLQRKGLASVFKRIIGPFAPLLPTGFDHPLRKKMLLLQKLVSKIDQNPFQTFRNFTTLDTRLKQIWQYPTPNVTEEFNHETSDWLHWALHYDQHQYLISDILSINDQAGMRHSLEIRTPYLENNLQAYLATVDPHLLFQKGQKWVLKHILAAQNGQAFIRRSKEGFGMPLGYWLRQPKNQYLIAELQDSRHPIFEYLSYNQTQQLLQSHLRRRYDYSSEIWALIVLAKWLRFNFS